MAKLHDFYKETVVAELAKQFGYKSVMQVPRIEKITLNMGLGEAVADMDCHMPVMDGLEATKLIRSMGDKARDIPIIALTANALTGDKEKCLKSGMDDFISKPVGVSRLKECIYKHLSKQLVSNENRLKDPA